MSFLILFCLSLHTEEDGTFWLISFFKDSFDHDIIKISFRARYHRREANCNFGRQMPLTTTVRAEIQ